jgi:hypothetical protein
VDPKMKLTRHQMRFLSEVQEPGGGGGLWTRFSTIVARNLHRKGLIEYRMGSLCEKQG